MSKKLIPIGYWRRKQNSNEDLPWPEEGRLPQETKELVAKHLMKGRQYAVWKGWSTCRICKCGNGSVCLTDGEFVYPEGYAHYILNHNIQPDIRLLSKVLAKDLVEKINKEENDSITNT